MTPETPAGARANAESAAPAGTSGKDFLATYRKTLAARNAAGRRRTGRHRGGSYRAGMARRPPEPDGGDAA